MQESKGKRALHPVQERHTQCDELTTIMFQTRRTWCRSLRGKRGLYLFKSDIQSATNFRPTAVKPQG